MLQCSTIIERKRIASRKYYQANREKIRIKRQANAAKLQAYMKVWRAENVEKRRDYMLRWAQGATYASKMERLRAQGNVCAICKTDAPDGRGWHQDHCHQTKRQRGVLCGLCNGALGLAKDDPKLLRRMAAYLEQHR